MASQGQEQKPQKRIGHYIIGKTLGKGTFGKVKLATHQPTGQKVAIKILQKDKIQDVADVQRVSRQLHILKLIRHPNIIQLYQIIQTPKHLFLVMELMENGELFDFIVSQKKLSQSQALQFFQQIISGIDYSHRLHIVHRDLKLQNLLLGYDNSVRLVDFGLSNTYRQGQRLRTACGSPCYAAPQMIEAKMPYQPIMVDIWSAGVILYAMVCGCLPFQDQQTPKLYRKIINGQYTLPNSLSIQLQDFISKILTVDPNKRIRIEGMRQHGWWKKHSNNYYPQGLVVGYHKMPIQPKILSDLQIMGIDVQNTQKCIEANRHNNQTTTYYLLLKKYLRQGNISKADPSGKYFDKAAIQPNKRRQRRMSLKVGQVYKQSPSTKVPKCKSMFKDNKQRQKNNQTFLQKSVKMPKKTKQKSKSKNKSRSKVDRSGLKSFTGDQNQQQYKQRRYSLNKTSNRSTSKKKNNLKDISLIADEVFKPKIGMSNTTKNKKSHQGSYLIGGDCGGDWPLQPKWKGQTSNNGKTRGALRRR